MAEHGGETRSHALRGNAVLDAPRRPVPAEGRRAARRHSHAERGNESRARTKGCVERISGGVLCPMAEHGGEARSHALRGNAVLDAPRRPVPAEGRRAARRHSHAERGNELPDFPAPLSNCGAWPKKGRRERSTRSSNRLPAPSGLGIRSRKQGDTPCTPVVHSATTKPLRHPATASPVGCSADAPSVPPPDGSALLVLCRLRRDSRRTQGQAQAVAARAARRVVREAERRPAKRRVEEPTAATVHAERAPLGA